MSNKEQVLTILEEVLEVKVTEETTMENCEEWDSFTHLQIIMELKDVLSLEVSADAVEKLTTVKSIIKFLDL